MDMTGATRVISTAAAPRIPRANGACAGGGLPVSDVALSFSSSFGRAALMPGAVVAGRFMAAFGIECGAAGRRAAGAGGGRGGHGVWWMWTWFAMSSSVPGRPSRAAGVAVLFPALAGSGTPPGRWSHDGRTTSRAAWSMDCSAVAAAGIGLACGREGGDLCRRLGRGGARPLAADGLRHGDT